MDNNEDKAVFDESSGADNSSSVHQERNIVEEMANLEKLMSDSTVQTFKKTTYWNQLNDNQDFSNNNSMIKEMLECMLRIEAGINEIKVLLIK